ncbi:MAG: beta strand repeat-containing protein, partial [Burkholderiales bacterium]
LSGANNFSAINEDPATNPGMSVSALIAGKVTDPDASALSGIAVTAVENSNGTWQYSINGGSTWNNFGTPSAANARLLAADGNTYVRFVPNANWNGTVTNGLTFRAWDRTSGAAGGSADTTSVINTVRDSFNAVSYSNNDGTAMWSAGWVDTDGDPSGGSIRVTGGELVLSTLVGPDSIYREANLSGATSATLSFSYNNLLGLTGTVSLQATSGGGPFITIATFSDVSNTGSGTFSTDISGFIAGDTRIRFKMNGVLTGGSFHADDVQISYVTPLNGGKTAFSTATASSSITVNSVNDAPTSTDKTVPMLEDATYVFTATDFSLSDANDNPANTLLAVKIATLPGAGSLTLSGAAVSAGQFVSLTDISAGNLVFTPALNGNGAGYASFTFQVQDTGGIANSGIDLDPSANTFTIDVTAVNDPPVGVPTITGTVQEDQILTADTSGISDADGLGAFSYQWLRNGAAIGGATSNTYTLGDADVGTQISVQVGYTDAQGTAEGPLTSAQSAPVANVNDAPVGADKAISLVENGTHSFADGEFGFSDVDIGDSLSAVRIDSLSLATGSTLRLSGVDVIAGQVILSAGIANLVFTPAANTNGAGYASFTFSVRDQFNAFAAVSNTMIIDVTAAIVTPAPFPIEEIIPVTSTPPPVSSTLPPASETGNSAAQSPGSGKSDADTLQSTNDAPASSQDDPQFDTGETNARSHTLERSAVTAHYAANAQQGIRSSYSSGATHIMLDGQVFTVPESESSIMYYGTTSTEIVKNQTIATSMNAIEDSAFENEMDRLRTNMLEESEIETTIVASTASFGVSLSVGYVFWLLRGGALVSSLLSSLPAWRLVDP